MHLNIAVAVALPLLSDVTIAFTARLVCGLPGLDTCTIYLVLLHIGVLAAKTTGCPTRHGNEDTTLHVVEREF